jgi:geranylgeranyl diphosphate synthase type II
MEFKDKIQEIVKKVDSSLDTYIESENTYPETIYKAMRYSLFAGGKRLRPILTIATCQALGGNIDDAMPFACALEMIHTYSLIHDDLPAMDNDDYRRGKLTNHKVFGDAMAILAGDGLLNKAAETMMKQTIDKSLNYERSIKAMYEIMSASGSEGMVGGQVVDLESEGKNIDKDTLYFMDSHKTGALIRAAVRAGAIIAGASDEKLQKLTEFAESIGLAFQIKDDILDVIGDEKKLGKKIGSDVINNKSTFVTIFGLEKSKQMAEEISKKAIDSLKILGENGEFLRQITDYLINREA